MIDIMHVYVYENEKCYSTSIDGNAARDIFFSLSYTD